LKIAEAIEADTSLKLFQAVSVFASVLLPNVRTSGIKLKLNNAARWSAETKTKLNFSSFQNVQRV